MGISMTNKTASLKDFIAKVIGDVHNGANKGKAKVHEPKCFGRESTNIDFDLAITSTTDKSSETNGQIAVRVLDWLNLQAGGESGKETTVSQANRIRFTIPLVLREKTETSVVRYTARNPFDSEEEY